MARLLDIGDYTFLGAKLVVGLIAASVLLKWGNLRVAKYGVSLALVLYLGLMGVHMITGLTALGYISENFLLELVEVPRQLLVRR